jgi:RNA polymerase sigma-70 factor, ECF subfamily
MAAMTYATIMNDTIEMGGSPVFLNNNSAWATRSQHANLEYFNNLVLEHQDAVYRQAYWILCEEDDAEDAAQEAFIRAYQKMNSYNGGPFRPWILRIVTNYCLDQLRRRKARPSTRLEAFDEYGEEMETSCWLKDTSASAEEILEHAEEEDRIMRSIKQLPLEQRVAVIMIDLQGLEYREAAQTTGVPLGTFKSRLWRGRMELQKKLSAANQPELAQ